MQKRDFLTVAGAILLAVLCYFVIKLIPTESGVVCIYSDGEAIESVPLDENRTVDINGTNTLVIENGFAYMESASCPDKLCVHQGRIWDSSKSIVCLPNKIVVTVEAPSDIDTVTH